MAAMESVLSVMATAISCIALIGVAVSLILQTNQLKANRVQIVREMHLELIRIGIENPDLSASVNGSLNFPEAALFNFILKFLETGYLLKTITPKSIALQAASLFQSENARNWWDGGVREVYEAEAETKAMREFFTIVNDAFQSVTQSLQPDGRSALNLPSEEE
jgi:Family of unknown function (DUF6082)